jgi:hypothetical protein
MDALAPRYVVPVIGELAGKLLDMGKVRLDGLSQLA